MLSNAYFLAKIRFDTAENEPATNLPPKRMLASAVSRPSAWGTGGDGGAALRHPGVEGRVRAVAEERGARRPADRRAVDLAETDFS